jgi:hypothetical protein
LRDKATIHVKHDMVTVLDLGASVVKSDTIVEEELRQALKDNCLILENVPDHQKDWHPHSDEKVLDLVHPSLFPLVYGRSKVLPHGKLDLEDCTKAIGTGEVIPIPSNSDFHEHKEWDDGLDRQYWSDKFQWLPSDVTFTENNGVRIASYVNSLHPVHHKALYSVLEQLISRSIPLWDLVMNEIEWPPTIRIDMEQTEYKEKSDTFEPADKTKKPKGKGHDPSYGMRFHLGEDQSFPNRVLVLPEPGEYIPETRGELPFHLRTSFAREGIQVIVKLANIHLTPEKPTYDGGSWHVEGMLNEHICATSLYYYDNDNIEDSWLQFRQQTIDDSLSLKAYDQDDYEGVEEIYGVKQEETTMQEIGRVLVRDGRLLAFPNVMQHRVAPFSLVDPTKPGHRKILALFLVDPWQRIISTANVPPQQKDWWAGELGDAGQLDSLPADLLQQSDGVNGFPFSMEDAKGIREELMKERSIYVEKVNGKFNKTFDIHSSTKYRPIR